MFLRVSNYDVSAKRRRACSYDSQLGDNDIGKTSIRKLIRCLLTLILIVRKRKNVYSTRSILFLALRKKLIGPYDGSAIPPCSGRGSLRLRRSREFFSRVALRPFSGLRSEGSCLAWRSRTSSLAGTKGCILNLHVYSLGIWRDGLLRNRFGELWWRP